MDDMVSIHAAKTHLSRLLARVEAGEVITIARGRTPIAKLVPVAPRPNGNSEQCADKSVLARSFSSRCLTTNWNAGINSGCDCFLIPMP
jgi:prevent-host-death family protein